MSENVEFKKISAKPFYETGKKFSELHLIRIISQLSRHMPYKVSTQMLSYQDYLFNEDVSFGLRECIPARLDIVKGYYDECIRQINNRDDMQDGVFIQRGICLQKDCHMEHHLFTENQESFFNYMRGVYQEVQRVSEQGAVFFKLGVLYSIFKILGSADNKLGTVFKDFISALSTQEEDMDQTTLQLHNNISGGEGLLGIIFFLRESPILIDGELDFYANQLNPQSLDLSELEAVVPDISGYFNKSSVEEVYAGLSECEERIYEAADEFKITDAVSYFAVGITLPPSPRLEDDTLKCKLRWKDLNNNIKVSEIRGGKHLYPLLRFLYEISLGLDDFELYCNDIEAGKQLWSRIIEYIESSKKEEQEDEKAVNRNSTAQSELIKEWVADFDIPTKGSKDRPEAVKNWLEKENIAELAFIFTD